MNDAHRTGDDRLLNHCLGLARWLGGDDRSGADDVRARLRRILGERAYGLLSAGLLFPQAT
jgi:hypothetical protein